jgi:fructose-1,6-bisphosphatase/inositol monophosphatase family enzyme
MTSTDLGEDAALAGRLVTAAGQLALRMRAEGVEAQQKRSVSDIVTDADHAAEALVLDRLRAERPEDGVVGEEGTAEASTSGRSWHVDPVDGTYNYFAGLDWWCSAVALVGPSGSGTEDVLVGAVHHPATDTVFVGGPDLPTTANGRRLAPLEDRGLATSCVTTYLHPPFYDGPVGAAFERVVGGAATLRMLGSGSMDHTAVARGSMHALVQHSVPSWDWWPGSALVRGAGGEVRRTTVAGVEGSVAGAPTAVAEFVAALDAG